MWKKLGLSIAGLSSVVLLVAFGSILQAGNTWAIQFGDPVRTGTLETEIEFSYTDANGVKQEKTISASVPLGPSDTPDSKRAAVEAELDTELAKPENQPFGAPLASAGGLGNGLLIDPANSNDTKIESIKTTDDQTGEDDVIKPPKKKVLAHVIPEGELLGRTSDDTPSIFFISTNLGDASVQLSPGMSKLDLLKALKARLLELDPETPVWVDSSELVLYVMLSEDEEGISAIGAGATDVGLDAVCKVMLAD